MKAFKDGNDDFSEKSGPGLKALVERICALRKELGEKTRPVSQWLAQTLLLLEKYGLERDFVIFTIVFCEWWFRVPYPSPNHIKNALEQKLAAQGFTPHNVRKTKPVKLRGVPETISGYVDRQLATIWDGQASEQSRRLLARIIPELTEEFTRPFRIATLQPLPPHPGGHPWQACWATGAIIYARLRQAYTRQKDSQPLEGALALIGALLDSRRIDHARFRRKRKDVMEENSALDQLLVDQFNEFKLNAGNVLDLLEADYPLHTVFSLGHVTKSINRDTARN